VVTFGAFVEIMPGVEGLVHISELAAHHVENPREVVSQGDTVRVKIIEVDADRRRLSLSLKRVEDGAPVRGPDGEPPQLDLSEDVFPATAAAEDAVAPHGEADVLDPGADAETLDAGALADPVQAAAVETEVEEADAVEAEATEAVAEDEGEPQAAAPDPETPAEPEEADEPSADEEAAPQAAAGTDDDEQS
jgi:small subunit ribosomal protein S1